MTNPYHRLLAVLLHYANSQPGTWRSEFYALKAALLARYATPDGFDVQLIVKNCWGEYGEPHCRGKGCRKCGGSGVYSRKVTRLQRYTWHGYGFHVPVPGWPVNETVTITGYVKHPDHGVKAAEARLWLYLLTGNLSLLGKELTTHSYCAWTGWPLLSLQWLLFHGRMALPRFRRCGCGRHFWTKAGWLVCPACRRESDAWHRAWQEAMDEGVEDVPF